MGPPPRDALYTAPPTLALALRAAGEGGRGDRKVLRPSLSSTRRVGGGFRSIPPFDWFLQIRPSLEDKSSSRRA